MERIALFFLLSTVSIDSAAEMINIKDCGSNGTIQAQRLTLTPYPLDLSHGLKVSASIKINRPLTDHVSVRLKIIAETFLGKIDIPCIRVDGSKHVGSCTYDLCQALKNRKAKDTTSKGASCGQYLDSLGFPCTCPIPAGTYTFPESLVTPGVPSTLLSLAAMGKYRIRIEITDDSTGEKLLCSQLLLVMADRKRK